MLAYALRRDFDDLFEAAKRAIGAIHYEDVAMRETFGKRMPNLVKAFVAGDRTVLVMKKTADQLLLDDLLKLSGGRLDPAHAAWIVSELEALTSFLEIPATGLVNADLGPDTLLVSPKYHSVAIAGGWWSAARLGEKLVALRARPTAGLPDALVGGGKASVGQALELVRLTAAEAMGHANPLVARRDPAVPKEFGDWLMSPPSENARDDYRSWCVAREASFGPRRFRELAVNVEAFYGA